MLFQLRQRFLSELLQVGVLATLHVVLIHLDGLLVSDDLIVGVGFVEILAITQLQDHGFGLVHQRGLVGHFQVFGLGQLRKLLIGLGVVVDHHLGELLHILRRTLVQGHLRRFDFCNTFGRSLVDEVFAFGGKRQVSRYSEQQGECARENCFGCSGHCVLLSSPDLCWPGGRHKARCGEIAVPFCD